MRKALLVVLVLLGLGGLGVVIFYVGPGGSGVLAALRLQDGSEYMVTQRYNNGSAEPYTVAFYMRSRGRPWGWCYVDHQAARWHSVGMHYDASSDSIIITKSGVRRATLDRKRQMFWIDTFPPGREVPAPQEVRNPDFPFPSGAPTT
jgi:hypothetical protein